MVERKSWAVSQAGGEITTLDGRHALGSLLWPGSSAMVKRNGRLPRGTAAFTVTATSPTPDGNVHVEPGHLWMMGTRSVAPYIATMDAIKDINILSTPAHGSLTRWDLIVAQQNDTLHSDANNLFEVKQVVGTPSSTPADPAVPGSPDYVVVARVVVGAGVTSITGANITQLLTAYTVPIGAILPINDQTDRDTLTGTRYDGMSIWRRDRDWLEVYDGTAWRVQDVAICSSTTDRDSAITNPKDGQLAVTTDTGIVWERVSGAWQILSAPPVMARATADTTRNNSTTLLNATGMSVSLPVGSYTIDGAIGYSSNATADIKFAFSATGTYTGWWGAFGEYTTGVGTVGDLAGFRETVFTNVQLLGGADAGLGMLCRPGGYINVTVAATLQLQFAQNVANASDTIVRLGSWLRFTRVA